MKKVTDIVSLSINDEGKVSTMTATYKVAEEHEIRAMMDEQLERLLRESREKFDAWIIKALPVIAKHKLSPHPRETAEDFLERIDLIMRTDEMNSMRGMVRRANVAAHDFTTQQIFPDA